MSHPDHLDEAVSAIADETPPSLNQAAIRKAFLAEAQHLRQAQPVSLPTSMRHKGWRTRFSTSNTRLGGTKTMNLRRFPLAVVLIIVLVAGAVLAQELIQFFTKSTSDQSSVNIYYITPTPGPTPDNFPLTDEQAVKAANFTVLLPDFIPAGYHFDGAAYDPNTGGLSLRYACIDPMSFDIAEQKISAEQVQKTSDTVGASAVIEDVQIGSVIGQYVRGAWAITQDLAHLDQWSSEVGVGTPLPRQTTWDNNSEYQQLRWYANDISYQIVTSGYIMGHDNTTPKSCLMTKADYAAIANGLVAAQQ